MLLLIRRQVKFSNPHHSKHLQRLFVTIFFRLNLVKNVSSGQIGQVAISTFADTNFTQFTTMKKVKNWKAYCKVCYNALRANVEFWGDPDYFRPITRTFYEHVFSSGNEHNGFISEDALNNPKQRTKDHCLSPQFIGRMIMDCLLYTSPSPRDLSTSRMPSSA